MGKYHCFMLVVGNRVPHELHSSVENPFKHTIDSFARNSARRHERLLRALDRCRWVVTGSEDTTVRLWLVQINKKFVGQSDVTDAIEKLQAHSHFGRPDIIQNSSRVRT
jgi:hypothetical protein